MTRLLAVIFIYLSACFAFAVDIPSTRPLYDALRMLAEDSYPPEGSYLRQLRCQLLLSGPQKNANDALYSTKLQITLDDSVFTMRPLHSKKDFDEAAMILSSEEAARDRGYALSDDESKLLFEFSNHDIADAKHPQLISFGIWERPNSPGQEAPLRGVIQIVLRPHSLLLPSWDLVKKKRVHFDFAESWMEVFLDFRDSWRPQHRKLINQSLSFLMNFAFEKLGVDGLYMQVMPENLDVLVSLNILHWMRPIRLGMRDAVPVRFMTKTKFKGDFQKNTADPVQPGAMPQERHITLVHPRAAGSEPATPRLSDENVTDEDANGEKPISLRPSDLQEIDE